MLYAYLNKKINAWNININTFYKLNFTFKLISYDENNIQKILSTVTCLFINTFCLSKLLKNEAHEKNLAVFSK